MYSELYQYLILNRQLGIPGIGTFQVERKPADIDFINKVINPPAYSITLVPGQPQPSRRFFGWLATSLNLPELDAVMQFNDFAFDLKEQIQSGTKLFWKGIGTISKGLGGEINFEPAVTEAVVGEPVAAVKVLREKAEHTVRVGEDEKTSGEMIEFLQTGPGRRIPRKAVFWTLFILAIIFVVAYFATNGLTFSSFSNKQKLEPAKESPSKVPGS